MTAHQGTKERRPHYQVNPSRSFDQCDKYVLNKDTSRASLGHEDPTLLQGGGQGCKICSGIGHNRTILKAKREITRK